MKVAKFIQKFKVSDGDVLLIKEGSPIAANLEEIVQVVHDSGRQNVVVLVVDDFGSVKALDEKTMNAEGWFRVEALRKLVRSVEGNE
jgi:hypothetical protein